MAKKGFKKPETELQRAASFRPGLLSTNISPKPLSPFQRKILQREKTLRFLRQTAPMDRAKAIRGLDNFKRQRDFIRSDIAPQKQGGLISNSSPQQALLIQRAKIMAANRRI